MWLDLSQQLWKLSFLALLPVFCCLIISRVLSPQPPGRTDASEPHVDEDNVAKTETTALLPSARVPPFARYRDVLRVCCIALCVLEQGVKGVFALLSTCRGITRHSSYALEGCALKLFGKSEALACKMLLHFQRTGETLFDSADACSFFNLTKADLKRLPHVKMADAIYFNIIDLTRVMLAKSTFADFEKAPPCQRRFEIFHQLKYFATSFQQMNQYDDACCQMKRYIRHGEKRVGLRLVIDVITTTLQVIETLSNAAMPFPLRDLVTEAEIQKCCTKPSNRLLHANTLLLIAKKRNQQIIARIRHGPINDVHVLD
jgi:hypothetical protein